MYSCITSIYFAELNSSHLHNFCLFKISNHSVCFNSATIYENWKLKIPAVTIQEIGSCSGNKNITRLTCVVVGENIPPVLVHMVSSSNSRAFFFFFSSFLVPTHGTEILLQ